MSDDDDSPRYEIRTQDGISFTANKDGGWTVHLSITQATVLRVQREHRQELIELVARALALLDPPAGSLKKGAEKQVS